jgi:hypothetical protein
MEVELNATSQSIVKLELTVEFLTKELQFNFISGQHERVKTKHRDSR